MSLYFDNVKALAAIQASKVAQPEGYAEDKKTHAKSVAAAVRAAAKAASDEGIKPEAAAKVYDLAAKATGLPAGTVKAYGMAIKGFVLKLADGESIDSGGGANGDKPLTAKQAQTYWTERTMTSEAREMAGLVALITLRLSGVKEASELQTIADLLPEHADETAVKAAKPESKKAREMREAAEAFEALMAEQADDDGETSEAEQAPRTGTNG